LKAINGIITILMRVYFFKIIFTD